MTALLERAGAFAGERLLRRESRLARLLVRGQGPIRTVSFGTTLALYPVFCGLSWAGTLARRATGRKPRVVWGPTPILTIAESSELLRRLGYPSTTVVFTTYHIRSAFDVNLKPAMANPALSYWLPNVVFLWSLLRFDVFHHYYDGGLWSGMRNVPAARWLELPLLRLAGKRVIASAYGADVRIRHLNELWQPYNICNECPAPGTLCVCEPEGLTRTKYYRDWSNALLALGDTHDFVLGSDPDFKYHPIDVKTIEFVGARPHGGPVRVVHSPNHRYFKGTRFVEAAVTALRERGYHVELDLVEGVPNEEARRRYAEADIVFAQCLAGWMGYTELEAMAAGKPVLGYIRDPRYVAAWGECPLVSASPDTLERELETLVADPGLREELGRRGRRYVEREWSYEALAPSYDALHEDVWTRNRLGATVARKWADLRRGEAGHRVGRPLSGSLLGEWPVRPDPAVGLRRLEAGLLAQPPFDDDGIPRSHAGERAVVVARHALDLFHLGVAGEQLPRFLHMAAWLRDRPEASALTRGLAVGVLLRAAQLRPGEGFEDAARAAATSLADAPAAEPGLEDALTRIFGLHEYARATGERWAAESADRGAAVLAATLSRYELPEGLRRIPGSDEPLPAEDVYAVVQGLHALAAITGEPRFGRRATRWARRLFARRTIEFLRLRAPL